MDPSTEVIDPIILIFLFMVFSIGAIGPVIFCVWGAKRAERERVLAARANSEASAMIEGQADASNENMPLAGLSDAEPTNVKSSILEVSAAKAPADEKLAVNA